MEFLVPASMVPSEPDASKDNLGVTEPVRGPVNAPLAFKKEPTEGYRLPAFLERAAADEHGRRLVDAQEKTSLGPPPDAAAVLRGQASAQGVPFTVALSDPKAVEPKKAPITWDNYADNAPLSRVLLDPTTAPLVSDEADRLAKLAGFDTEAPWRVPQLESGSLALEEAHLWTKRGLQGGVLSPEDGSKLERIETRLRFLPPAQGLGDELVGMLPMIGGNIAASLGGAAVGAAPGLAVPGLAPVGAALGARAGSLAFNTDQMIGMNYKQYTQMGMPHAVAWPAAMLAGAVAGGIDTITFGLLAKFPALKLLSKVPGVEALNASTIGPAMKAALKDSRFAQLLTSLGKDAAVGGTGNALQEAVGILGAYAANTVAGGQYQTPSSTDAAARVFHAAGAGAAMGTVFGGASTLFHETLGKVARGEGSQVTIDRLYDATENLKTADRAPDVLAKYGNEIAAQGGPIKYLTMPVEDIDKLLSTAPENPALAAWLARPETDRQLSLARESGARVTLPLGDFVAYIRPLDKSRTLNQVIGLNDEMSPKEAKELSPAIQKARKEMEDLKARTEANTRSPEAMIVADLEKKLRAVGHTTEAARIQAEIVASGVATLARRTGKDPWATYRESPLTVSSTVADRVGKSLDQADPAGVVHAPDTHGDMAWQHPESPLRLWSYDNSFDLVPVPKETSVVSILGFDRSVPETKENIAKYGGQGYSTALYLKALEDAQQRGVGFASDTTRTKATLKMYDRLRRLGIPFEKMAGHVEGSDFEYLPAEKLKNVDLNAAWDKLVEEQRTPRGESGVFASVTDADIERLVGGLQELRQKQSGEVRGRITFDPEKRDWFHVTLTGKANLSTFIHEGSHYLLEVMRKLADEHPETDLTRDLKTLEEWAGVKPGEAWSDAALEKFARGMETYFGEGRAPSAKLAGAMATVKSWILHVYKTLKSLGAPLTDEVRGVMDRMLASQEEIDARKLELGYFPNEILLREGDMTPEEQQHYRDLYEKGAQQAQASIDREAIAALRKEQSAEYQRIAAAAEKEVDKHPAIALRAWLDGKGRPDGGLAPDVMPGKFDEDLVPKNLRSKLKEYTSKGAGVDPAEVAPFFGFKNGQEVLDSLATTPARSTLKSQMVKAEMTKLYPAYGPDKTWVERTALERLHEADAVSNAIEVELRTIYKKAGLLPPNSPALVAQQAAKSAVTEMSRKELRLDQWRAAERKMLEEQQKALAAKDFKAAAEFTRKRLYNRAMWQEASKAIDTIDRADRYVTRYTAPNTLARLGRSTEMEVGGERVGSVLRDAARALVEGTGHMEKSVVSEQTFDTYVSKLEDAGLPVSIDPTLRERPLKAWNDLTLLEAQSVQNALKNFSTIARDLNGIRIRDERVELDQIANAVEASMRDAGLLDRLGQRGEKFSRARKARSDITKPETIVLDIDGGKIGEFHKAFIQTAEAGQFENERRKGMRREDIRKLGKEFQPENWAKQVKQEHVFDADGRTYTGGEVFAMLLNFSSNREKLIKGMQKAGHAWTEERVLGFIHEVFPKNDVYHFAQAILNYINRPDLFDDAMKVREAMSGWRPEKVESQSIPMPEGGEMKGGYYHLIYDNKVPLKEAEGMGADALNAMHDSNPLNMYAANGFTKGRTGYVAPILLNPTAWTAHLYEVDHFISNAQGIVDRHKLLQHPRIKSAIIHGLGHEYWMALKQSNNFIASDGRRITAELLQASSVIDKLLFHNAILTMGGNLLSGVNQVVTGLPATLTYLGPRAVPEFAKALLNFAKNPFATWEEVVKRSGEVENMSFHYDRDLRLVAAAEVGGKRWETIRSQIAATTMAPVVFGQKMVNVITWKAAEAVALAEGKQGADVVAHANSVVRQSQSAAAPKDFTAVQRSHDGLMRVLTSLASYQFTLNDLVMPRQLTRKQLTGSVARTAMLITTTAMTKALFDAITPKLEEKDAERRKGIEKAADESEIPGLLALTEATMNVLGNVPLVGRTAQSVLTGREPRYASWVDTILKSVELGGKVLEEKGFTKSDVRAMSEAVGLAAGVPTRHILFAPGEFGWELVNGNIEDNPWSFFQELALVRPGQKGEK